MRYPKLEDHYGPAGPPLNPWLSVWLRPRATIRYILNTQPLYGFFTIILIFGFTFGLSTAEGTHAGDRINDLTQILLICLIAGPVGVYLSLYLGAYFLRWAGRRGNGKASIQDLVVASTWPCIPLIIPALLYYPRISKHGVYLFTERFTAMGWGSLTQDAVTLEVAYALVSFVFMIWSLILLSKMIAEVQGFESGWKGFRNYLLALLYIVLLSFAVFLPIAVIARLLQGG